MKRFRWIPALCAFFAAAIGISACGSGVPGNAVVDMAGNPVTVQAFNHWMYLEVQALAQQNPGTPVIVPNDPPTFTGCIAQVRAQVPQLAKETDKQLKSACSSDFSSLSSQVLQFLITSYWYQAEAVKQHINVTAAQVQKEFNTERKQAYPTAAAFNTFLKQSGQTLQDILFKVRFSMIEQKLLAKYMKKVTSADISAYYQSHISTFGSPESLNMRVVLTKTAAQADAAKSALQHGQSWKAVAAKYSTDQTTKNKGGLLTGVTKGQQDTALNAAFTAPVNKLTGPIKSQFGYYVFEVLSVKKATQQTLQQATQTIQSTLGQQAQTNAQNALTAKAKKDWLAKTTCRKYYAMNQCKGYKATSTTSSTSTG
jgi:foldase protein PrsA